MKGKNIGLIAAAAGVLLIALIWIVAGTRTCGPVYRSADKEVALKMGDTVPALQQNGDTTVYRYECIGGMPGQNLGFFVAGLLLIGGLAYYVAKRKKDDADPLEPYTAANAADYWKCAKCGHMNPLFLSSCGKCGTGKGAP